jgi:hypothetical protein
VRIEGVIAHWMKPSSCACRRGFCLPVKALVESFLRRSSLDKPAPPKRQLTTVDLGKLTGPWRDYCQAKGVSSSEGLRQIVANLAGARAESATPLVADSMQPRSIKAGQGGEKAIGATGSKHRLEVRLSKAEQAWIEGRAAVAGFTPTAWLLSLVRSQMTGEAQLGQAEMHALMATTTQLRLLEQDLRRLARQPADQRGSFSAEQFALVEALAVDLRAAMTQVTELVLANAERWHHRKPVDHAGHAGN